MEVEPLGAIPRSDVESLAAGEILTIVLSGRKILVCRVGDEFHAVENRCSHVGAELSAGSLEGFVIECPFHGARFDVRDGCALTPPARGPIAAFDLVAKGDAYEIRERSHRDTSV